MFKVLSNGTMRIVQGDTGIFDFSLNNYTLKYGDKVYFTVRESYEGSTYIFKEVSEFENGVAKFILTSEDTNITEGLYLYDVQCNLADGRVDTVIKSTKFQVLGGITNV